MLYICTIVMVICQIALLFTAGAYSKRTPIIKSAFMCFLVGISLIMVICCIQLTLDGPDSLTVDIYNAITGGVK